jgi:hypothetical protein
VARLEGLLARTRHQADVLEELRARKAAELFGVIRPATKA